MVARRVKPNPDDVPGDVELGAQETPQDEPETALPVEEVVATPLDIESRWLEHQRRINKGGK